MRPQRLVWATACTALGALAIALVLIDASTVIRAPVVLTFLLLCPGLAFVRLSSNPAYTASAVPPGPCADLRSLDGQTSTTAGRNSKVSTSPSTTPTAE